MQPDVQAEADRQAGVPAQLKAQERRIRRSLLLKACGVVAGITAAQICGLCWMLSGSPSSLARVS